MYALMAVGLTLVYGLLRILHIAHAAVYAFGAFITVVVANATGSIALGILVAVDVVRDPGRRHLPPALSAACSTIRPTSR